MFTFMRQYTHFVIIILVTLSIITTAFATDGNKPSSPLRTADGKISPDFYYIDADSSHDFDVLDYYIMFWPYHSASTVEGICRVTFTPVVSELNSIFLHAEDLNIILVQDESLDTLEYTLQTGGISIDLDDLYTPADTVIICIGYQANVVYNYFQPGFHRYLDYGYTSAEPYGARKWFPCYDYPFDKATAHIEIVVPTGYYAASNGNLDIIYTIEDEDYIIWIEEHPISTYLISIACGPYLFIEDSSSAGVPLDYYVYPEDSADAIFDFANTGLMIDFFSELIGEYPFDHYGMAEAKIFNGWGAMEHQSVTTFGSGLITGNRQFEYIVAHELAHMWWGDCLSPLTFDDIWLNEGFATYTEALDIEARHDTLDGYMVNLAENYFWEDANSLRYPIYAPPPEKLFGTAVYDKGAWVLHMLRHIMGDDDFFSGMSNYFEEYKYGSVITAEHQAQMEAAYGGSLDWYYQEWVYQAGYPVYIYSWDSEPLIDTWMVDVGIEQLQTNAPLFIMPVDIYLGNGTEDTLITLWNNDYSQDFQIELDFNPNVMEFDPGNHILKSAIESGIGDYELSLLPEFTLNPAYPNPFNNSAILPFEINSKGVYTIKLFNAAGQTTQSILLGELIPGEYSQNLRALNLSSGIYWVELSSQSDKQVQKIILLK